MDYLDFYCDGFDTPTAKAELAERWINAGSVDCSLAYLAAFLRQSLRLEDGNAGLYAEMAAAHDYVLVGWRHYRSSTSVTSGRQWIILGAGATERVSIRQDVAVGDVTVHLGGSGTPTLSVSGAYTVGSQAYFELEVYRHAVSGYIGLYRDGNLIGSFSGDTSAMASAVDRVTIMPLRSLNINSIPDWYRDVYFCGLSGWSTVGGNNLGPGETAILVPSADVSGQFTPLAGVANSAMVDDSPHDGDSTYNVSNTPGHVDLFSHAGISTASNIFAVMVEYVARADEIGVMTMHPVLDSGVVREEGGANVPGFDYLLRTSDVYLKDPADLGAWTESKVNALEFGYANEAAP